jgi:hypothetical protein
MHAVLFVCQRAFTPELIIQRPVTIRVSTPEFLQIVLTRPVVAFYRLLTKTRYSSHMSVQVGTTATCCRARRLPLQSSHKPVFRPRESPAASVNTSPPSGSDFSRQREAIPTCKTTSNFRVGGDSTGTEFRRRRRVVSVIAEGALPPRRHRVVCLLHTGVSKAHRLLPSLNPAAHGLGVGKALAGPEALCRIEVAGIAQEPRSVHLGIA